MRAALVALGLAACSPGPGPDDSGMRRPQVDIFTVAAAHVPGGLWTAGWMPASSDVNEHPSAGQYGGIAYFATGYVDIPAERVPTGGSPGRIVAYDGRGNFRTVCDAPAPLRAIAGASGIVLGAGDRLVRSYEPATGSCTTVSTPGFENVTWLAAAGDTDGIWLAGTMDGPMPRGVLARWDGSALREDAATRDTALPVIRALADTTNVGAWAAGDGGLLLHRAPSETAWTRVTSPFDGPILGIASESQSAKRWSMAVGGTARPTVLSWNETAPQWVIRDNPSGDHLGYQSIFLRNDHEVYLVGDRGDTTVFNGSVYYLEPSRVTDANVRFVVGNLQYVFAGGGYPDDAAPTGAVLVRGDLWPTYHVDDDSFTPVGNPRVDFGGGAGSQ